ncbi:MAG: NADH-quinone oxidoreductase subunit N [bacterium]
MTPSVADLRSVWPELTVAGAALVIMVWGTFLPPGRQSSLRWVTSLALIAGLSETVALGADARAVFGGMYTRDAAALVMQTIALGGALIAVWMSGDYLERARLEAGEFYALVLVAALGAMVMAAGSDLLMVFLGLETLSIPLYVLAAYAREDVRSQEAGMKYFLLGAFSTVFFLYGVALIYGVTGSTSLVRLGAVASADSIMLRVGIGLLLVGLAFKAAIVPFHAWAPDVYEGAPLPVTAYMSVIAKVGAFAALARIFPGTLGGATGQWVPVLALLSILTMILGNFAALLQTNLKRLLAYSGIAHAGFMMIGVASGTPQGAWGVSFYLVAYTFMTLGAFAVVLMLERRGEEADQIADLTGLASRSPSLAAAMAVCMVSLAGLPPTAGFIAKFYVFAAALDAGLTALAVIGVLASVVSAYFYLRVAYTMFIGAPRDDVTFTGRRWVAAALVVAVIGVLGLGVYPAPVTAFVQQLGQVLR